MYASEQLKFQQNLKRSDLTADRTLGQAQFVGGTGNAQVARTCLKSPQEFNRRKRAMHRDRNTGSFLRAGDVFMRANRVAQNGARSDNHRAWVPLSIFCRPRLKLSMLRVVNDFHG
jgi:hypothetical protein